MSKPRPLNWQITQSWTKWLTLQRGSTVEAVQAIQGNGKAVFNNVCPGSYFFTFGTPGSDRVSVTSYFEANFDGHSYSNPEITVFYSRNKSDGLRLVGNSKRRDL